MPQLLRHSLILCGLIAVLLLAGLQRPGRACCASGEGTWRQAPGDGERHCHAVPCRGPLPALRSGLAPSPSGPCHACLDLPVLPGAAVPKTFRAGGNLPGGGVLPARHSSAPGARPGPAGWHFCRVPPCSSNAPLNLLRTVVLLN